MAWIRNIPSFYGRWNRQQRKNVSKDKPIGIIYIHTYYTLSDFPLALTCHKTTHLPYRQHNTFIGFLIEFLPRQQQLLMGRLRRQIFWRSLSLTLLDSLCCVYNYWFFCVDIFALHFYFIFFNFISFYRFLRHSHSCPVNRSLPRYIHMQENTSILTSARPTHTHRQRVSKRLWRAAPHRYI